MHEKERLLALLRGVPCCNCLIIFDMSTDYWSCGASIQALLSARSVNMASCVATADRMCWQQAVSGCLQPDELEPVLN